MEGFDNGFPLDGPWNWTEDYRMENGNYVNLCACGRTFHGHKRRVFCRLCQEKRQQFGEKAHVALDRSREVRGMLPELGYPSGYLNGFVDASMAHELSKPADTMTHDEVKAMLRAMAPHWSDAWNNTGKVHPCHDVAAKFGIVL